MKIPSYNIDVKHNVLENYENLKYTMFRNFIVVPIPKFRCSSKIKNSILKHTSFNYVLIYFSFIHLYENSNERVRPLTKG